MKYLFLVFIFVLGSCATRGGLLYSANTGTCFDKFKFSKEVPNKYGQWSYQVVDSFPFEMCLPEGYWSHEDKTAENKVEISVMEEGNQYFPPFEHTVPYTSITLSEFAYDINLPFNDWLKETYNFEIIDDRLYETCRGKFVPPDTVIVETTPLFDDENGDVVKVQNCQITVYFLKTQKGIFVASSFYGFNEAELYEEFFRNILLSTRLTQAQR